MFVQNYDCLIQIQNGQGDFISELHDQQHNHSAVTPIQEVEAE